jgi:nucleoside-diphosphate-sugar epimerase
MPERFAITGATGFVGRVVVDQLVAQGKTVAALVRNPGAANLHPNVRVVAGDLKSQSALQDLMRDADVVLHIAGAVNAISRDAFLDVNVAGTVAVAEAAKQSGVKRFVYVSSLAATQPALNFYAESKAKAEAALQAFASHMMITVMRPAAVYGPGDTATLPLLQALMSRVALIPGTPEAVFAMVHVEDVARSLVAAAMHGDEGVFELDDGSAGYHWPDLIALTREHFGVPRHVVYVARAAALGLGHLGDVWSKITRKPALVNSGQIKQIYHGDWRVKGRRWALQHPITLPVGLPQTIRWYQAQGMLPLRDVTDRSPAQDTTLDE